MPFTPSPQQTAVLNWIANGSGSAFVEAVAGAGKTTTLIEGIVATRGTVAFTAYNKKIAVEIEAKVADRANPESENYDPRFAGIGNRLRVGTFHSFGFGAWRRVAPGVKVDARAKEDRTAAELNLPKSLVAFVPKLVSLAKQRGLGLFGVIDDQSQWFEIVEHFDLAHEIEDEMDIQRGVELGIKALRFHTAIANELIDFDDMIYMPVVTGTKLWQNDWVFVDEAQDTNPARRALARKMLKNNGRAVFVGDRHQAVYGFCHPAGTPILTADGWKSIEKLSEGSPTIVFSTSGDVAGWKGGNPVLEVHKYNNKFGRFLELRAANRSVQLTPHHRVPVKIAEKPQWFVYMMRRCGAYRVGYCASHTTAGEGELRFMFSQRCKTEKADSGWLLEAYGTKQQAQEHEARLIKSGVTGTTFHDLSDEEVRMYYYSEVAAKRAYNEILLHDRHPDFPIWRAGRRQHFEANVPFITEACNILPGMRVQVLGDWDSRKRGRSRHTGGWHEATVRVILSSEPTYGITVKPIAGRPGYQNWPLYAAGNGIIVHNTGADNDAVDLIMKDFNCITLPLTVTFRCPKAVVAAAHEVVSRIEAHETAPEGVVRSAGQLDYDQMIKDKSFHATGDAILCRITKPLVSAAYSLIRKGIACHVEGKDIGVGLIKLANKYAARTVDDLRDKLELYLDREVAKLISKGKETQAEALQDRIETLFVIMDECTSLEELRQKTASMFLDGDAERKPTLTMSTIHKAKGREWNRVFLLGRYDYMPSKWARQAWQMEQEANLIYVAYTRAKNELVLLTLDKPQ